MRNFKDPLFSLATKLIAFLFNHFNEYRRETKTLSIFLLQFPWQYYQIFTPNRARRFVPSLLKDS